MIKSKKKLQKTGEVQVRTRQQDMDGVKKIAVNTVDGFKNLEFNMNLKDIRVDDFVSQSRHFVLLQLMRLQTTSRHTETVLFVRVQMCLSKLGNKIDLLTNSTKSVPDRVRFQLQITLQNHIKTCLLAFQSS